MSLRSAIKKQFIDILQWTEEDEDTLAWRYPMDGMEIQHGGVLVVRESQMALFVNEGKVADVFRTGHVQINHADLAGFDVLEKLGQTLCVALQKRCLFFQYAATPGPALGYLAALDGARP